MSMYDALAISLYDASIQMHPNYLAIRVRNNSTVIEGLCKDGKLTADEVINRLEEIGNKYKVAEMLTEMLQVFYEALGVDPTKVVRIDAVEMEKQLNENY